MEQYPKEDMETESKCPEISSSWILLSTDEDPKVSEKEQESIGENVAMKNEQDKEVPSFEDVIQNTSDTNNRSDAESDSISIISESEFLTRSDDDSSTNSSDENSLESFNNVELSKSNHVDELPELYEDPAQVEVLPTISYSTSPNDSMTSDISQSNESDEVEPAINPKPARQDGKFTKKEFIDYFKTISKYNSIYFFGTIIFAVSASYLSSILTQDDSLNQKNMQINEQMEFNNDEIINTHIHEYGGDIYECTSFNHDYTDDKCVKISTKDIKQTIKFKPKEKETFNSEKLKSFDPDIQETEITSDKYNYKENNEEIKCKNKKKCRQNKNSESFKKLEKHERKYQNLKKYSEITEEKLLHEKQKIENWRNTLTKEEKRLKEWEKKLLEMEKKLYKSKKDQDNIYTNKENKNKYKKDKEKKYEESERSFQNKKDFKKNKSGGKKMYIPLDSQNQKNQRTKIKNYEYKRKISLTNDAKMKKFGDVYKQKKNQSATLDDNITITGEWYLNLLKGRNEKRGKGDKAEWWFERANFRKNKRNKAYWYFQYMFNREDLRYVSSQNTRNV